MRTRVRRDDGERWGLMVRDGARAPPRHEGLISRHTRRPHPEERAWRASPDDASHRLEKDGPQRECRCDFAFSRRVASEFFHQSCPLDNRGRREGRVPFAPMVRVQQKSTRQNHRYEPNNRPSLRNGFNGFLRALPGETGLCCHRRFASSRKARHLHRGARTTRLRRPRHVVRLTTRCVHRIPLPTSVTIAKRPSCGSETRGSSF